MKKYCILSRCILFIKTAVAQGEDEKIRTACLNYIEGFYEGDTTKLRASLMPSLYKLGYYRDQHTGKYLPDGNMTYRQALDYASWILKNKKFAKADAPKKVELLNIRQSLVPSKQPPRGAWIGTSTQTIRSMENRTGIRGGSFESAPQLFFNKTLPGVPAW